MKRFASAIIVIVAAAGVAAACHPRNQTEQAEQRHGRHGLRKICADDIQKYCQNEDRKRRCLRQNLDKLSADCKAAVEALRNNRNKDDTSNSGGDNND